MADDSRTIEISVKTTADLGGLNTAAHETAKVAEEANGIGEGLGETLKQIPELLSSIRDQVKEWDSELDEAMARNADPSFIDGINEKKRAIEEYQAALEQFKMAAENAFGAEQQFIAAQRDGLELLKAAHDAQLQLSESSYGLNKAMLNADPSRPESKSDLLNLEIQHNNDSLNLQKDFDTRRKLTLQRDVEIAGVQQNSLDKRVEVLSKGAAEFNSRMVADEARKREVESAIKEAGQELARAEDRLHNPPKAREVFDGIMSKDPDAAARELARQTKGAVEDAKLKLEADQKDLTKIDNRLAGEKLGARFVNSALGNAISDANANREHLRDLNSTLQQLISQIQISWPAAQTSTQNNNLALVFAAGMSNLHGGIITNIEQAIDVLESLQRKVDDHKVRLDAIKDNSRGVDPQGYGN